MTRLVAVLVAALLVMSGCNLFPKGDCDGGAVRCSNNTLQSCGAVEMFGPASWHDIQACISPQVCKMNAAGPAASPGTPIENGCFDPNEYCHEGALFCASTATSSSLWSCILRASDQTFRWSQTTCSDQVPRAICVDPFGTYPPPPVACYEVVSNCPASDIHCEGNVLLTCASYPSVIDNKAVFDWQRLDCTLGGQVCRVTPQVGASCVPP